MAATPLQLPHLVAGNVGSTARLGVLHISAGNVGKWLEDHIGPYRCFPLLSGPDCALCTSGYAYLRSGFGYLDISGFPMLLVPINVWFAEFNMQLFRRFRLYCDLSVSFLTHFCCRDFQDSSPLPHRPLLYHIWPRSDVLFLRVIFKAVIHRPLPLYLPM